MFHGDGAISEMSHCNVINNTQNNDSSALFLCDGPTTIKHCSFFDNDREHKWFEGRVDTSENSIMILIDCSFDDTLSKYLKGLTNVINAIPEDSISFLNAIRCTSNNLCEGEYDYYGTVYPHPKEVFSIELNQFLQTHIPCTQKPNQIIRSLKHTNFLLNQLTIILICK